MFLSRIYRVFFPPPPRFSSVHCLYNGTALTYLDNAVQLVNLPIRTTSCLEKCARIETSMLNQTLSASRKVLRRIYFLDFSLTVIRLVCFSLVIHLGFTVILGLIFNLAPMFFFVIGAIQIHDDDDDDDDDRRLTICLLAELRIIASFCFGPT